MNTIDIKDISLAIATNLINGLCGNGNKPVLDHKSRVTVKCSINNYKTVQVLGINNMVTDLEKNLVHVFGHKTIYRAMIDKYPLSNIAIPSHLIAELTSTSVKTKKTLICLHGYANSGKTTFLSYCLNKYNIPSVSTSVLLHVFAEKVIFMLTGCSYDSWDKNNTIAITVNNGAEVTWTNRDFLIMIAEEVLVTSLSRQLFAQGAAYLVGEHKDQCLILETIGGDEFALFVNAMNTYYNDVFLYTVNVFNPTKELPGADRRQPCLDPSLVIYNNNDSDYFVQIDKMIQSQFQ
jgi:hypothetical protein